jgi:hypothetical protein
VEGVVRFLASATAVEPGAIDGLAATAAEKLGNFCLFGYAAGTVLDQDWCEKDNEETTYRYGDTIRSESPLHSRSKVLCADSKSVLDSG